MNYPLLALVEEFKMNVVAQIKKALSLHHRKLGKK